MVGAMVWYRQGHDGNRDTVVPANTMVVVTVESVSMHGVELVKTSLRTRELSQKNEEEEQRCVLQKGHGMCEGVGARLLTSIFGAHDLLRVSRRLSQLATALCRRVVGLRNTA